jgi:hypothetical protein
MEIATSWLSRSTRFPETAVPCLGVLETPGVLAHPDLSEDGEYRFRRLFARSLVPPGLSNLLHDLLERLDRFIPAIFLVSGAADNGATAFGLAG